MQYKILLGNYLGTDVFSCLLGRVRRMGTVELSLLKNGMSQGFFVTGKRVNNTIEEVSM